MSLSVAIITKNEENHLPSCLQSVSFADEVVVVDACSNDETVKIAKSLGAHVFVEPWKGFSAQKQFAVDQCSHKWVLVLDADEKIPPETASRIIELTKGSSPDVGAYSLRRKNYLHNKWIRHCGWWPNPVVRLVDKRKGAFDGKDIHESWLTESLTIPLKENIDHLSFKNYSDLLEKMNLYSTIGSIALYKKKAHTPPLKPFLHGLWMFIKTYFLELGVLNGFDGFVISLTNAGGSFFKYAKHLELKKQKK